MNLNSNQRFSEIPSVNISRSKFLKTTEYKTTFDAADIIPIYVDEILPGDTVKMDMSCVVRMATPLYPVMDNAFLDIFWFFVPTRIVWSHWKEFWGENTNAWYPTTNYTVPQITTDNDHKFGPKSTADYMGLPINTAGLSVSALPFRCYVKIWNDWFRDTNLQQEAGNVTSDTNSKYFANLTYTGGQLLKANKYHDYFTSALPNVQRGPQATLPLGTWAPVTTRNGDLTANNTISSWGLHWNEVDDEETETTYTNGFHTIGMKGSGNGESGIFKSYAETQALTNTTGKEVYPTNLWTDLSLATSATISSLREAIAVQHFFEAMARGGGRYTEFLQNIFGVTTSDARLQRSEFLGSRRIPINITTVLQSSATTQTSPLGQTGAFSHTADYTEYFTKSFEEHGYLMGLAVVRTNHSYSQGIERMWSRTTWDDYFIPQLEGLSEQAILLKEIYAQGTSDDETAFGYQERYSEYKYKPSMLTGSMRPNVTGTLSSWNYGDNYTSAPVLGSTWIQETKENIDRTLAVTSSAANQFIGDFYFEPTYVRPMKIFAVPGLEKI